MQNAHTCNTVSDKFGIPSPSLQEYLEESPRTDSSLGFTRIERFMQAAHCEQELQYWNLNNYCDLKYFNLNKQFT